MAHIKTCRKCKRVGVSFSKSKKSKDGLLSWCKGCVSDYDAKRYKKPGEKARLKKKNREIRERNKKFTKDYLANNPCVDCGESDPIVLEFDHVRGEKDFAVSLGVQRMYSLSRIEEEIKKCEVRCANCHRRVTHQRRQREIA